ncbi:gluconokinase [Salmonirosea aquatica]|uniref:Carbohydrate kinase n=1 Tax=Salmonirosea aquatica TaxID=2654236 RepID=A0A7C9F7Y7_9BACT|nr:carbohydrate kinase [Cytophagaceae bacterium SJW1-29]
MAYIIGADIGTTNVKAVAFTRQGEILGDHSEEYPMYHPHPDWSEQDPEEIVRAVEYCIQTVVKKCRPHGEALGLSFSAAMHSLIALDAEGKPLSHSIIWADNRSASVANALRGTAEGKRIYKNNGTPIHAMAPVCKLLWLRENDPKLFKEAARFVGIKEYVVFKLTGKYLIDYSIASATGLFNIRKSTWDDYTLKYLHLTADRLSEPVSPYHTEELAADNALGLPEGTPLIMGASDGCLANLGSGAIVPGTMAVTVGTSGAVRVSAPEAYADPEMRTFCYILDEGTYVIGGASNNGAVIFEWLKDHFFDETDYETLFRQAADVAIGSDGLLCLPYLLGERAPLWNSTVRGGFVGLDIHHTPAHFVRAVMEGILLNLLSIGKVLIEKHEVKAIYANGGFAKSKIWVQMLADIFGITVNLNDTVETGSVGAALMGLKALGHIKDFADAKDFTQISHIFKPNAAHHQAYEKRYEEFIDWAKMLDKKSKGASG